MYGIQDSRKRIEEKNENIVKNAKAKLDKGDLNKAKELFEQSLEICQEENWEQGINYAVKMIKEIDEK